MFEILLSVAQKLNLETLAYYAPINNKTPCFAFRTSQSIVDCARMSVALHQRGEDWLGIVSKAEIVDSGGHIQIVYFPQITWSEDCDPNTLLHRLRAMAEAPMLNEKTVPPEKFALTFSILDDLITRQKLLPRSWRKE